MRLLEGVAPNLGYGKPFGLEQSPTRFGRVTLQLEPLDRETGWKLDFALAPGQLPGRVELPAEIAGCRFKRMVGAKFEMEDRKVSIDPHARRWTAFWGRSEVPVPNPA
jgi:hypothetical protein